MPKRIFSLTVLALGMAALPAAAQEPQLQWQSQLPGEPVAMLGYKPIQTLVTTAFPRPVLKIDRPSFESWVGGWGRNITLGPNALSDTTTVAGAEFLPPVPVKLTKAAGDSASGPDGILAPSFAQTCNWLFAMFCSQNMTKRHLREYFQ